MEGGGGDRRTAKLPRARVYLGSEILLSVGFLCQLCLFLMLFIESRWSASWFYVLLAGGVLPIFILGSFLRSPASEAFESSPDPGDTSEAPRPREIALGSSLQGLVGALILLVAFHEGLALSAHPALGRWMIALALAILPLLFFYPMTLRTYSERLGVCMDGSGSPYLRIGHRVFFLLFSVCVLLVFLCLWQDDLEFLSSSEAFLSRAERMLPLEVLLVSSSLLAFVLILAPGLYLAAARSEFQRRSKVFAPLHLVTAMAMGTAGALAVETSRVPFPGFGTNSGPLAIFLGVTVILEGLLMIYLFRGAGATPLPVRTAFRGFGLVFLLTALLPAALALAVPEGRIRLSPLVQRLLVLLVVVLVWGGGFDLRRRLYFAATLEGGGGRRRMQGNVETKRNEAKGPV